MSQEIGKIRLCRFIWKNQENLAVFLQHLKVAIRGLGRIGEKVDLVILEDIKKRQNGFLRLGQASQHESLVMRVMDWVDVARQSIVSQRGT